ncbi:MAG: dienelactone hydrolase family protein [Chloroflexota bacterium]|nr:dienelactone hydrolase family protein [Chloroflexota bacterium]
MLEIGGERVVGHAHLATPAAGAGPGVLVLHAWWGLTPFFKQVADRLAAEGYYVLAPDLYAGQTATTIEEATQLRDATDDDRTYKLITESVEYLRSLEGATGDGIGVVGFSMGGWWALSLEDHIRAVVTFYGAGVDPENITAEAAYQGHFAEDDEFEPLESVKQLEEGLRARGKEVEMHIYPSARHWFFEKDRPEYDPEAAKVAWERTCAFLARHLQAR